MLSTPFSRLVKWELVTLLLDLFYKWTKSFEALECFDSDENRMTIFSTRVSTKRLLR